MTAKPILFSAPMVRALLAGTKTQTRRLVKPQPDLSVLKPGIHLEYRARFMAYENWSGIEHAMYCAGAKSHDLPVYQYRCQYAVGDILWVRETWQAWYEYDKIAPRDIPNNSDINYPADGNVWKTRVRSSLHMPKWASRITLEVTGVRVERLQDISAEDCKAEGVKYVEDEVELYERAMPLVWHAYGRLWESIYGPGSWELNPWVWVYTFSRMEAQR